MNRLVHGVGINDADYNVNWTEGNVRVRCKYYQKWKSMLMRCYCAKYLENNTSYAKCTVCDEWKSFKTFKQWMECQPNNDLHLDKDILKPFSTKYSPDTCIFVPRYINNYLEMFKSNKASKLPIGVTYNKDRNLYEGKVRSVFKPTVSLKRQPDAMSVHFEYLAHKIIIGKEYAESLSDARLKEGFLAFVKILEDHLERKEEFKINK